MILRKRHIDFDSPKEGIKKVLKNVKGGNIISFSNYVNEIINKEIIKNLINLLNKNNKNEIEDIYGRLLKYNEYIKIFDKGFEEAKKESIFDYSYNNRKILINLKKKEINVQKE